MIRSISRRVHLQFSDADPMTVLMKGDDEVDWLAKAYRLAKDQRAVSWRPDDLVFFGRQRSVFG